MVEAKSQAWDCQTDPWVGKVHLVHLAWVVSFPSLEEACLEEVPSSSLVAASPSFLEVEDRINLVVAGPFSSSEV